MAQEGFVITAQYSSFLPFINSIWYSICFHLPLGRPMRDCQNASCLFWEMRYIEIHPFHLVSMSICKQVYVDVTHVTISSKDDHRVMIKENQTNSRELLFLTRLCGVRYTNSRCCEQPELLWRFYNDIILTSLNRLI